MALENGWLECPEMTHDETIRMLRICDVIRRQLGVIYPFENGSVPEPGDEKQPGATAQETEVIEVSPELQIAPQEDNTLFVDGPVADACEAEVIEEKDSESKEALPEELAAENPKAQKDAIPDEQGNGTSIETPASDAGDAAD